MLPIELRLNGNPKEELRVYIPRRDTNSRINSLVGGRIFPGVHHFSNFEVKETEADLFVHMQSQNCKTQVLVDGTVTDKLSEQSIFESVEHVSRFFESGSLGYSPSHVEGEFDGLELETFNWQVRPLKVNQVESSFFQNRQFPSGSVEFDNALLMQGIDHLWHGRPSLCC